MNDMNKQKAKRLEAAGWKIGNAADFIGLSPEESERMEFKLELTRKVDALLQIRQPSIEIHIHIRRQSHGSD